jgi:hypothetical protein
MLDTIEENWVVGWAAYMGESSISYSGSRIMRRKNSRLILGMVWIYGRLYGKNRAPVMMTQNYYLFIGPQYGEPNIQKVGDCHYRWNWRISPGGWGPEHEVHDWTNADATSGLIDGGDFDQPPRPPDPDDLPPSGPSVWS